MDSASRKKSRLSCDSSGASSSGTIEERSRSSLNADKVDPASRKKSRLKWDSSRAFSPGTVEGRSRSSLDTDKVDPASRKKSRLSCDSSRASSPGATRTANTTYSVSTVGGGLEDEVVEDGELIIQDGAAFSVVIGTGVVPPPSTFSSSAGDFMLSERDFLGRVLFKSIKQLQNDKANIASLRRVKYGASFLNKR